MKSFKYLLCLICFAMLMHGQVFAEDATLKERLAAAVNSNPVDAHKLRTLAEECRCMNARDMVLLLLKGFDQLTEQSKLKEDHVSTWQMAWIASAICELGGNEAYQSVVTRFAAVPPNSPIQRACAITLLSHGCRFTIENELKNGNKPELVFPEVDDKLPGHLQKVAPELQDAWRYFQQMSAPYRAFAEDPETARIPVQQNWGPFYSVIENTLVGTQSNVSARVQSFGWGGWCGTGSDQLTVPKSRAMVLGLLADGKYAESVGAVLDIRGPDIVTGRISLDAEFGWKRQWIEFCGLDWERLFLGNALVGWNQDLLRPLAVYGSEESAMHLVALATGPQRHRHTRTEQLPILAIMVEPGRPKVTDSAHSYTTSRTIGTMPRKERAADAPEISIETETMILDVLHEYATDESDPRLLRIVVDELARLKRTESIPTLRQVAAMQYYDVAKTATQTLQAMGEDVALPDPPMPGRFQFLHAGKPMPKLPLGYSSASGARSTCSSGGTTSTNGVLNISGSWFTDPNLNTSIIHFSSRTIKTTNDVVFSADVPIPADRSQTIAVPVVTHLLRLVLKNVPPGKELRITLEYRGAIEKQKGYRSYYGVGGELTIPHQGTVTFPHLGEGRYVLRVRAAGRALWKSREIIIDRRHEIEVPLRPGANVKFTMVAPGGDQADKQVQHELLGLPANNRHNYYDYKTKSYHGLPTGEYTLKVLSSAEKRNSQPRSTNTPKRPLPAFVRGDYGGREIKFSITGDTPVIDLGRIELQFIQ